MTAARQLSAVVMPVPEAEHLLRPWRSRHTEDGRRGMWTHITLLYPFAEPHELPGELERLRSVFAQVAPFHFALTESRRFEGGVSYLAPEPAEPFGELAAEVQTLYPDRPLYGRPELEFVPHCTVAVADDAALLDEAEAAVRPSLPIEALALEAWLVELFADTWSVRARLPFR